MERRFTHDADRFLGAKNSGATEYRYSYLRLDRLKRCSISVYVDNLPYEMDEVWLCQIFRRYGDVVDVYIPNKRSSRYNTKFGFIRFLSMEEALRAIQDLNGTLIRDFHIQVNLAKFSQSNRNLNTFRKSADFVASKRNPAASDFQVISNKRKESNGDFSRSFADVVTGKCSSVIKLSVKATEEGNPWLSRSAIAKLPSMRSLESLREAFIAEGVWNIQIRSMGGKLMLLTFSSVEDMNLMLEDRSSARTDSPSSFEEQSDSEKGDNVGNALLVCNKGVSFDLPKKDLIGETIALREDVESNNLSLPFVEDDRNHTNEVVVEPNEAFLGAAAALVDDDHHSQDPENVL
ncbi:hypothetical protein Vadar_024836 [Vaccinium darrowii]|uniref:Uncharacterized protein n=1 Tax=Vaccinium darrowii TaxID=229202 RepID=A0ACB7YFK9_9ERIC|nr:hypothetical protein Vadar_024836 [Vaccinium darrowii]